MDRSIVKQEGTIAEFKKESAGARSDRVDVFQLEEYPALFSRSYSGINRLIAPNLREFIYQPPPPSEIEDVYYQHPILKSKKERLVTFYIPAKDLANLNSTDDKIPYLYLKFKSEPVSSVGYYLDTYVYVYKTYFGVLATFISLLLFIACCVGAAGRYQHNNLFLGYVAFIIIVHVLIFIF
ncbi:hypothetical protein [Mucilaginibacter lappiensis]|uniref:Uncharacterized protein n=1 Tax=Mucilaginibacter lappiensis TaxID=354630 RepID=A0A841JI65_9SPHI|nr:hypothetical protein [Mucilaginibacter lappiensis]MBB6111769.1 hypothetical protein [Mucilaginibacter lappiensis]MBB6128368.1 hypothetical protein [Mucilaginibacter lappiensis]